MRFAGYREIGRLINLKTSNSRLRVLEHCEFRAPRVDEQDLISRPARREAEPHTLSPGATPSEFTF